MKKPLNPPNEVQRQKALDSFNVLDTHAETAYDDITLLASQICNVPIAVISLIDRERQWFKSKVGIEAAETSREVSFCGHAILTENLMEIPDAIKDERFHDNPLVTSDPNIRFYAGAPLILPTGEVLGTICVIDRKPRTLTAMEASALTVLARNVVLQLEMRAQAERIEERERTLNQGVQESLRNQKERAEFFAKMSHELRTPLNGLLGMLRAGNRFHMPMEPASHYASALTAGENMLDLLNNILNASALESSKMTVEPIDFDLYALIERTLNLFRATAHQKALRLTVTGLSENSWVTGDPLRVSQILNNLVGNALKFTSHGHVEIACRRVGEQMEMSVRDTGPGMSPQSVALLFRPYSQVEGGRGLGGTGLGLSVVQEIAHLLGGAVAVESESGKGSVFTARLPLPVASLAQLSDFHGLNALVVEDTSMNVRVFRAILEPEKVKVHAVTSGEEALARIANGEHFDFILMDRHLPGADGLEVIRRIRNLESLRGLHTPIFGTSATGHPSVRTEFLNAGASEVLPKPVNPDELWSKLKQVLGKKRSAA